MPVYRVNNCGAIGLIDRRDRRPYEIPPNGWSFASNCRMLNGSVVSVDGQTEVDIQGGNLGDATAHALDYYTSTTGDQWWYAYTESQIISIDNNGVTASVGKSGLAIDPYPDNIWITDKLNGIPLATNNRDQPQCFYNSGNPISTSTLSQDFPDWTTGGTYEGATARIVRAYKNFIVALNIVDGEAYPNMVAWSDAADPGLMPSTWDYTATDNLAGRTVLGAESGVIIAAEVQRDSLIIYTEYSTYRMDFVGGQFVMRFTRMFQNSGAFGPRCVGKFGEKHFVVTKTDVIQHDGQQLVSVADGKTRNLIFETLDESDINRIWVSPFLEFDEMWVGAPNTENQINTAVVWQWDEGAWAVQSLIDSRHMAQLPTLQASAVDDSWDGGADESWDGGSDNIWNAGGAIGDLVPVATSTDTELYYINNGTQLFDTRLVRQDINLSGDQSTELARALYLRIQGENVVQVRIGHSNTVEGALTWGQYLDYDPNVDYVVYPRANGRRHAVEVRGKGFDLEGYDIEWSPAGRR